MKKRQKHHIKVSDNEQKRMQITPNDDVIYQRNMAALREFYPEYAKALDDVKLFVNYRAELTGNNNRLNVFSLRHNVAYYQPEEPIEDVKNQISMLNLKNAKIAVFLGFGLGFIVDYYARFIATVQGTQHMIIIERDLELFKTAITFIDYSPMIKNPNIKLILGEKENDLFVIFEKFFKKSTSILFLLKCIKTIYHESAFVLDRDYYLSAVKRLKESVIFILQFFGNDPYDSIIGIENMLDNIVEIIKNPGINLLYNKFKGRPAVVVSTGPSLNKNKHLLKGLEGKAVILCPDASLRVLMDIDVKPHLATALERIKETATLLEGFAKDAVNDVYYAATPVIPNIAYETYPGPRIVVYRNFDHFKWLQIDRGVLDIKHSSGNMAFKIAAALGCDPIILIGQDLAYSRDGKTHASGSTFGEIQELGPITDLIVTGNDGQPIRTTNDWNMFRNGFEVDIAEYNGTCINSTEGGAYINGTVIMPFQEAIDKYIKEEFNPLAKIEKCLSVFSTGQIQQDIEKILNLIDKTIKDLDYMSKQCMDGLEEIHKNQELLNGILNGETSDTLRIREILDGILKYKMNVMQTNPTMQLYLMHIVQSYHIKFEIDMNEMWEVFDAETEVLARIALEHAKWYAIIHDIIKISIKSLEKAREKITVFKGEN